MLGRVWVHLTSTYHHQPLNVDVASPRKKHPRTMFVGFVCSPRISCWRMRAWRVLSTRNTRWRGSNSQKAKFQHVFVGEVQDTFSLHADVRFRLYLEFESHVPPILAEVIVLRVRQRSSHNSWLCARVLKQSVQMSCVAVGCFMWWNGLSRLANMSGLKREAHPM